MTNGEKKAILLEYRAIERRINRLIDEKAAWNAKATATTSSFSDMPRSGGGSDKIQTTVEKIIEIEEKLDHEIDALVDLRNRIEAAVEKLEALGVINSPDYWLANYKNCPSLDLLLCALGGSV